MHRVKCPICQKFFDRDKESFVQINNKRYAHKQCFENKSSQLNKEQLDLIELNNYINTVFKDEKNNFKTQKQIEKFKEEFGYSYSGMLKTLKWWIDIKHNPIEKMNGGIGIIPYIYQEAENYYYNLYLAKQATINSSNFSYKAKEYNINPPTIKNPKIHLFWEEEEDTNEK